MHDEHTAMARAHATLARVLPRPAPLMHHPVPSHGLLSRSLHTLTLWQRPMVQAEMAERQALVLRRLLNMKLAMSFGTWADLLATKVRRPGTRTRTRTRTPHTHRAWGNRGHHRNTGDSRV